MHETNINIILGSASSSYHESISRSLSVLSMFSMMDSLKSALYLPNLSEFYRYIYFVLGYQYDCPIDVWI